MAGYVPIPYPSFAYLPGEPPQLVKSKTEWTSLQAAPVAPAQGGIGVLPHAVATDGRVVSVAPTLRKWATAPVVEFKQRRD